MAPGPLLPLLSFVASCLVGLVALNASQSFRPLLFFIGASLSTYSFAHISDVAYTLEQANLFAMFLLVWQSHLGCALLVEKYKLPSQNWSWVQAYKMLFNARWIGTKRIAPDIPMNDRSDHPHGTKTPPKEGGTTPRPSRYRQDRLRFLFYRVLSAASIYALDMLFHFVVLTPHPTFFSPMTGYDFSPEKQSYLRRLGFVTLRESIIRIVVVANFLWDAWSLYTLLHHVLAFVHVGIGLDEPEEWPPLYGSLAEAWSLRRFWGKFWHRLVYRTYLGYGGAVANMLRLRNGAPRRMLIPFFVFTFSGIIHGLSVWQMGFHCGYVEEVYWFWLNFVGVIIEELMLRRCRKYKTQIPQVLQSKWVGHIWVFAFLFWSLPKSQYSKVHCLPL